MLKRLLLALLAITLVLVIVIALQPADYRLTRSTVIAAPVAKIFPYVNDLHRWEDWSPWARLDPAPTLRFAGPSAGVGASFQWDGNDKVGTGIMTITESKPDQRVRIRTDFVKPFAGTSDSEFVFWAQGGQTSVTWTMSGTNNFVGKAICLVYGLEKTVGPDFERGLAQLKQVAEEAR